MQECRTRLSLPAFLPSSATLSGLFFPPSSLEGGPARRLAAERAREELAQAAAGGLDRREADLGAEVPDAETADVERARAAAGRVDRERHARGRLDADARALEVE